MLVAISTDTGAVVKPGDTVIDFRNNAARLATLARTGDYACSGKVTVDGGIGWLNDNVFNLSVRDTDDGDPFPCGCPAQLVVDTGHQTGCVFNP